MRRGVARERVSGGDILRQQGYRACLTAAATSTITTALRSRRVRRMKEKVSCVHGTDHLIHVLARPDAMEQSVDGPPIPFLEEVVKSLVLAVLLVLFSPLASLGLPSCLALEALVNAFSAALSTGSADGARTIALLE